jgi:hypothetical protein
MNTERTSAIRRRARRGLVAGYIHTLSARHGERAAAHDAEPRRPAESKPRAVMPVACPAR